MKYRLRRRMSQTGRRRLWTVIIALLVLAVLGGAAYYIIDKKNVLEGIYTSRISELKARIDSGKHYVYRTLEACNAGTVLSEDIVEQIEILTDECDFVDSSDFGRVLLVDVPAGLILDKVMLSEAMEDSALREVEYNCIDVTSNISSGDYVDIRIMYPDGTDYVVMSKKQIKKLSDTKLIADLWVNENELLLMDSSIVDAALFDGTRLYATAYILPGIQEPSVVNYTPSEQIAELLEADPNAVKTATDKLSQELRQRHITELESFYRRETTTEYDQIEFYN